MGVMLESELKSGKIFGDFENNEYVYMPASEFGVDEPLCVYETLDRREDVTLEEALRLVRVRSLRPVKHPRLGKTSC